MFGSRKNKSAHEKIILSNSKYGADRDAKSACEKKYTK
jgi:hypothetical protein